MRKKFSSQGSCGMSTFRREQTNKHIILMSGVEVYLQREDKHTKNIPQIPWGINRLRAQLRGSPTPMLNYQESVVLHIRIRTEVSSLLQRYDVLLCFQRVTFWKIIGPPLPGSSSPSTSKDKETKIFTNTVGRNSKGTIICIKYSEITWKVRTNQTSTPTHYVSRNSTDRWPI